MSCPHNLFHKALVKGYHSRLMNAKPLLRASFGHLFHQLGLGRFGHTRWSPLPSQYRERWERRGDGIEALVCECECVVLGREGGGVSLKTFSRKLRRWTSEGCGESEVMFQEKVRYQQHTLKSIKQMICKIASQGCRT